MEFLNPEKVLKRLKLKEDITAADFGSGSGGWTIPLAKIIPHGRVFALDILEEMLSALRAQAKAERIENIETIKADIEKGAKLLSDSCDLVLVANILFQADDKGKILEEAKRILKPGGIVLVVDWNDESKLCPARHKISVDEIKEMAKSLKLKFKNEVDAGVCHHALVFNK